ncbi:MerR family transcriptional regulator [Pseudosulfitobacter sp. DSM 107133]|uniref:MerR family transcriptional regulator n=1 Tax=Pseudosulfitobacter sp. DSM 107133 TaxID=2883100 RepID=UPI000DF3E8D5|nr:MerR family transcriptional regulator [Pseudosulfitobacter sp. DSM 107133]UOA28634.1 HTH-type transcriptional regulator HmrR [Pseudosulfitobacter sp. DSM 107133]
MQIGELSGRTGVSVRMLRYYEQEGLLTPARRNSGYRDYDAADVQIVNAIRMLNDAGLKLEFIRRFLPCLRSAGPILPPCPDLMAAMRQEMQVLDGKLREIRESRDMLGTYYKEMSAHL